MKNNNAKNQDYKVPTDLPDAKSQKAEEKKEKPKKHGSIDPDEFNGA